MVIPSFNLDSVIDLKSREFSGMCKELNNISESVIIKTEPDKAYFHVKNDKIGEGHIMIRNSEGMFKEERYRIQLQNMCILEFPLNYLNMFNKAAPLCDKV